MEMETGTRKYMVVSDHRTGLPFSSTDWRKDTCPG